MENNVISACIYTAYEQVVVGMIDPNPHLCHYFLQNIIFYLPYFLAYKMHRDFFVRNFRKK